MRLDIRRNGNGLGSVERDHLEQRLMRALHRFEDRITWVRVYYSDQNGPKGGRDQCLRCVISFRRGNPVTVEVRDSNLHAAIDRMANRVGFVVREQLQRLTRHRGLSAAGVARA